MLAALMPMVPDTLALRLARKSVQETASRACHTTLIWVRFASVQPLPAKVTPKLSDSCLVISEIGALSPGQGWVVGQGAWMPTTDGPTVAFSPLAVADAARTIPAMATAAAVNQITSLRIGISCFRVRTGKDSLRILRKSNSGESRGEPRCTYFAQIM